MKKLLLSALISASVAQSAAAVQPVVRFNLTGMWTLDLGIGAQVSITQNADNTFEGYCYYPKEWISSLGNNITTGEKCVYGTVDPDKQSLVGKVLVYDAIPYKEKCPTQAAQWTNWVDISAGYKVIANAIVGVRNAFVIKDDCSQVENAGIRTITYAAPNHCIASYVAMAGEAGDLRIPCLEVRLYSPTGEQQTSNYSVDLKQQNPTAFTFDLNLDTIQKRDKFQMNYMITSFQ
jgi:opacity protein-like surface antigen